MIAWVIQPKLNSVHNEEHYKSASEEAVALSKALPGVKVTGSVLVPIKNIRPKEFFGSGKIIELSEIFYAKKIGLVIINSQISPIQQQYLEKKWKVKILDRTSLILEIFSDRASTKEGVLQVEICLLYTSPSPRDGLLSRMPSSA